MGTSLCAIYAQLIKALRIKSPKECKGIVIDPATLKNKLFMCHEKKSNLKGTNALDYIEWGESQKFHLRPSCSGRNCWWDLGGQESFDFVVLRFRDQRNWSPINVTPSLYAGDIIFVGNWEKKYDIDINNVLINTTFSIFISEIYGRLNLGQGLLTTYGPDIKSFDFFNAAKIPVTEQKLLIKHFEILKNRNVGRVFDEIEQEDRKQLDDIVLKHIGLTPKEIKQFYTGVRELLEIRIQKSISLKANVN